MIRTFKRDLPSFSVLGLRKRRLKEGRKEGRKGRKGKEEGGKALSPGACDSGELVFGRSEGVIKICFYINSILPCLFVTH